MKLIVLGWAETEVPLFHVGSFQFQVKSLLLMMVQVLGAKKLFFSNKFHEIYIHLKPPTWPLIPIIYEIKSKTISIMNK